MASAQMRLLLAIGHQPHKIDRKRYGQPWVALYWASRGNFQQPGLHLWVRNRQYRVIPLPRAGRANRGAQ